MYSDPADHVILTVAVPVLLFVVVAAYRLLHRRNRKVDVSGPWMESENPDDPAAK